MHSFRLRYVALGLLIYIQSAFSDTCGSDGFVDVASSTVLSSAVFEGQPKKLARLKDGRYLVWFKVTTIYKGNLTGGVGNSDSLHVLVGNFGPSKDRDRCIASTAALRFNSRTSYLVFLNRTGRPVQSVSVDEFEGTNFTNYYSKINNSSLSSTSSVFYYSISGFPENATRQACQEARNYSSRNSGIAPRIELHVPRRHLKVGKKLQLTCRVKEGRPPPVLTWFKNGTALEPTNKMVLRKKGKALNLIIRHARATDAGFYQCRAANVLGSTQSREANVLGSTRSKNLTIELVSPPRKNGSSRPRNDSSEVLGVDLHLNESHVHLCENQDYCNGRGICIFVTELAKNPTTKPTCRCQKDWEGYRCEDKVTALSRMASDNKKRKFKRTLRSHS